MSIAENNAHNKMDRSRMEGRWKGKALSTTMRTTGRRTLAGIAAGALAFAGLAFVAAPSAQAADEPVVFCAGAGGAAGVPGDPTSVSTDCFAPAGPAQRVPLKLSNLLGGAGTPWVQLTLSGGTFATTGLDDTNSSVNTLRTAGWFASPTATAGPNGLNPQTVGPAISTMATDDTIFVLVGSSPQTITVTVATSSVTAFADITSLNTVQRKSVTITVTGAPGAMNISPAYKVTAVGPAADDSVAVGLVQVFGADGLPIPITTSNITLGQIGTAITLRNASPADCTDGAFTSGATPLNGGEMFAATEACVALGAAGTGVWLIAGQAQAPGTYSVTAVTSIGGVTFNDSISYKVAGTRAAAGTVSFDKERYLPGERAVLTWCLTDLAGNSVADGLGWTALASVPAGTDDTRTVIWTSNAITSPVNFNATGVAVPTYDGCLSVPTFAPATPMVWNVATTIPAVTEPGWTAAVEGAVLRASAVVGSPAPDTKVILIEGTRGVGSDANRVYVEGTTQGLTGQSVTPFFRFPGETGFTAGTGTRTVDAQGNFNWQRKTGKKIAVQFRDGDVTSNTVIIEAK